MNKNKPILTVFIYAYNHEKSIKKSIESVLEQKTKYKYVIWLLEDCSTDKTLDICKNLAKNNPDKIELMAQPVNSYPEHILKARTKLKTKYFTILEGDDYWCDDKKIETAISFLEKNKKYVTFAHDTQYFDHKAGTKKSLVHDIHKIEITNPVTIESAPYLHMSSRLHRSVIDFKKNPVKGDIYLYYSFLDRGPLYYHDKIMSVYNIEGKGEWSKLSFRDQQKRADKAQHNLNRTFKYRHDRVFSSNVSNKKN